MDLKEVVEELLKKEKHSMSWLSKEMKMTPDGFRLSLINETIKYSSIVRLCRILGVKVSVLFGEGSEVLTSEVDEVLRQAQDDKQGARNDDRQTIKLLTGQVRDKQLIIDLLMKEEALISGTKR